MNPPKIIGEPNRFITSSDTSHALRQIARQDADSLVKDAGAVRHAAQLMLKAADEIDSLRDALFWCAGSPSFAPGGEAHEGWQEVVEPLMRTDE